MSICLGNGKTKLYMGTQNIKSVFRGVTKTYPSGNMVTYVVDGAEHKEDRDIGEPCLTPVSFTVPDKEGYFFSGWSEEPNGAVLENKVMGGEPVTLYAVYLPNELVIDLADPAGYVQLVGGWDDDPDTGKKRLAMWASKNTAATNSGTIRINYGPYKKARMSFSLEAFNMNQWYDTTPPTNDGNIRIDGSLVYYTFRQNPFANPYGTHETLTSKAEIECSVYGHTGDHDSFCWLKCCINKITLTT